MKKYTLLGIFTFLFAHQCFANEFYVRPDGGSLAQCDGQTNTAYSDTISNRACAVSHIFELLDPENRNNVHIAGGDIVNILNNSDGSKAEYEIGRHGEYVSGNCHSSWNYDCYMPSIPGGSSDNPTIIRGAGWDSGCATPPQLWGSGRAKQIFTINGADNVEISCLELTDHSSCIAASGYPDASLRCNRSAPYDKPFADKGIYMKDSGNIKLTDLTISGLDKGIHAGNLGDVTLTRVHLYANHGAGWEGDLGTGSYINSGTVSFIDSAITFSGCGLIYDPGQSKHGQPHACAKQDIGGYGDGLGTAKSGGDWVFENTDIMYNNSDGIDLLYHELGGKVTVRNSRIEGNGGNQLKIAGNSEIVNNLIISNCGWNSRQDPALGANGENCRALGTALALSWAGTNDTAILLNNTVISEGDCLLSGGDRTGVGQQNQALRAVNNIFYAATDYLQTFENSCMYYTDTDYPIKQLHNNIIHQTKGFGSPCESFVNSLPDGNNANDGECTSRASGSFYDDSDYTIASNPYFQNLDLGIVHTAYDLNTLTSEANLLHPKDTSSPAYNTGYTGSVGGVEVPSTDFMGRPRNNQPDIGALEYYVKKAPPLPPAINKIQVIN